MQPSWSPRAVLVAIDDTDNETSPGTGYLAQQLLAELDGLGLADPLGATRHQLLVDPRVPYTTHNSSACLLVEPREGVEAPALHEAAADFLQRSAAPGSDPGLAVVRKADVADEVVAFGQRAKVEVLDQDLARASAARAGVRLTGHGGTEDGVIGALAAVGLHRSGADGFYLWLDGIRGFRAGRYRAEELHRLLRLADARTLDGARPEPAELVDVDPWVRPLHLDDAPVLLLERRETWRTAPKAEVRRH